MRSVRGALLTVSVLTSGSCAGALGPEQLQLLKEQLREQLEADPMLQRLVQRATGIAASDNEG